jgi:hypothetical protein
LQKSRLKRPELSRLGGSRCMRNEPDQFRDLSEPRAEKSLKPAASLEDFAAPQTLFGA